MAEPQISTGNLQQESSQDQLKYKGVRKRKWGKWVSEIRLPNSRERIWLGSYDKPEKAARAFDAAQYCLRGPRAKFNFPDSPPEIAGGHRFTAQEIQAFAAEFASERTELGLTGGSSDNPEPERECSESDPFNVAGFDGAVDRPFFDEFGTFDGGLDFGFDNIMARNEQFYNVNMPFPVEEMEQDEELFLWNFDTYQP